MSDEQGKNPHYYTLIASLPAFKPLKDHKALPLTTIQLDRRLKFLTSADLDLINTFTEAVLEHKDQSTEDFFSRVDDVLTLLPEEGGYRELLFDLLKIRAVVALARRSNKGKGLPENFKSWETILPDIHGQIETNWQQPDLGLGRHSEFKFILPLRDALKKLESKTAERIIVKQYWQYLKDEAFDADRNFGLLAVLIYVLQWKLLRRWIKTNPEESLELINQEIDSLVENTELEI